MLLGCDSENERKILVKKIAEMNMITRSSYYHHSRYKIFQRVASCVVLALLIIACGNSEVTVIPPTPTVITADDVANRSRIVYAKTFDRLGGEFDLYTMKPDGSDQQQLTSEPGLEISPEWSPDGKTLAFASTRDSRQPNNCVRGNVERNCNYEIYTIQADGTNLRRITDLTSLDRDPSWSPDGKRLAWTTTPFPSYKAELAIIDVDGSNMQILTDDPGYHEAHPEWSPDGTQIVWTRFDGQRYDLYTIQMDDYAIKQVMIDHSIVDDVGNANATWSPDGNYLAWIVMSGDPKSPATSLGIMNADGTNQQVFNVNPAMSYGYVPSWSPDGQHLVYIHQADGSYSMYKVNRDGTNVTQLSDGQAYYSVPAWSPILEP